MRKHNQRATHTPRILLNVDDAAIVIVNDAQHLESVARRRPFTVSKPVV